MTINWKKREKKKMQEMGVKPQPLSGATPFKKEDGESETLLVQLKSTQGVSIAVKLIDVLTLIKNAITIKKTPVFVLDFVEGPTLYCMRKEDIMKVARALENKEEVETSLEEVKINTDVQLIDLL